MTRFSDFSKAGSETIAVEIMADELVYLVGDMIECLFLCHQRQEAVVSKA